EVGPPRVVEAEHAARRHLELVARRERLLPPRRERRGLVDGDARHGLVLAPDRLEVHVLRPRERPALAPLLEPTPAALVPERGRVVALRRDELGERGARHLGAVDEVAPRELLD